MLTSFNHGKTLIKDKVHVNCASINPFSKMPKVSNMRAITFIQIKKIEDLPCAQEKQKRARQIE